MRRRASEQGDCVSEEGVKALRRNAYARPLIPGLGEGGERLCGHIVKTFVSPAKAGVRQSIGYRTALAVDPGLRRDDEK